MPSISNLFHLNLRADLDPISSVIPLPAKPLPSTTQGFSTPQGFTLLTAHLSLTPPSRRPFPPYKPTFASQGKLGVTGDWNQCRRVSLLQIANSTSEGGSKAFRTVQNTRSGDELKGTGFYLGSDVSVLNKQGIAKLDRALGKSPGVVNAVVDHEGAHRSKEKPGTTGFHRINIYARGRDRNGKTFYTIEDNARADSRAFSKEVVLFEQQGVLAAGYLDGRGQLQPYYSKDDRSHHNGRPWPGPGRDPYKLVRFYPLELGEASPASSPTDSPGEVNLVNVMVAKIAEKYKGVSNPGERYTKIAGELWNGMVHYQGPAHDLLDRQARAYLKLAEQAAI